jgi:probable rRNA maturation factor
MTEKKLQKLAVKMLAALGVPRAALDIVLLKNTELMRMKWRLLRKRTEPNVLSFPEPKQFPNPEIKKRYLGEVYLNQDILKKSPAQAVPLLAHGILHLLGYDHMKKNDAVRMERLEKKVLAVLKKSSRSSSRA